MRKIVMALLCALCVQGALCAQEAENTDGEMSVGQARALYSLLENLKEESSLFAEEVSPKNLYNLLSDDYKAHAALNEDTQELVINNAVVIRVQKERALLTFETYMNPPAISVAECEHIANEWTRNRIFSRAYYDDEVFYLDYFLCFDGGIHADNLNNTLDWFFTLASDFVSFMEQNGQ